MSKRKLRLISLVLVPGLLMNPSVSAGILALNPAPARISTSPTVSQQFNDQALMLPFLAAWLAIFPHARAAEIRQRPAPAPIVASAPAQPERELKRKVEALGQNPDFVKSLSDRLLL